ncbi:hypothetical protein KKA02_03835 [Patescibacteria group bacterium]|nr:hypothetical protein [Patescibacteria group bacterium]
MKQFRRSRLKRSTEKQITRSTVLVGLFTLMLFLLVVFFGVPFLVRFSIFLGESKNEDLNVTKKESLPPLAPRIFLPFEATNSGEIKIIGAAETGVVVELFKDGIKIDSVEVLSDGDFYFDGIDLNEGENVFSSIAVSEDDKKSPVSRELLVVYDEDAPGFEMTNPTEDTLVVEEADFDVKGKTEKDASVLINGKVAMLDNDGNFKLKIQLDVGKNEIEIKVRDLAGNESKKNIVIDYDF